MCVLLCCKFLSGDSVPIYSGFVIATLLCRLIVFSSLSDFGPGVSSSLVIIL